MQSLSVHNVGCATWVCAQHGHAQREHAQRGVRCVWVHGMECPKHNISSALIKNYICMSISAKKPAKFFLFYVPE
jgi:hypothetical protein